MPQEQTKQKIDGNMITLTDLFRRSVQFEQHECAEALVKAVRLLTNRLTYLPDLKSAQLSNDIHENLEEIASLARKAGLEKVTLPFTYKNPHGQWLREKFLQRHDYGISFRLMRGQYRQDNKEAGTIRTDLSTDTILDDGSFDKDFGIIGMIDIKRDLHDKWRCEPRVGKNLEFKL